MIAVIRESIHPNTAIIRRPSPGLARLLTSTRRAAASDTRSYQAPHPGPGRQGEDDLPNSSHQPESPARGSRVRPSERASDLVRHENRGVELRGFEPLTPSMRTEYSGGQTRCLAPLLHVKGY
jgi:hypothetical protein